MTIAELDSVLVEQASTLKPGQLRCIDTPSVLDTTELRWFFAGPLPADVGRWFAGASGVREERCDTYLLDGRCDVGVKRRFREKLELKVRHALAGHVELGGGLSGTLEVWRRWSPAEELVDHGSDDRWADVCKSIVKRRFSADGTEVAYAAGAPATGAGCDVEVADVTVGTARGWTLAFAAFGPCANRCDALLASWQGLVAASSDPEPIGHHVGSTSRAMGYPEWLALTVS